MKETLGYKVTIAVAWMIHVFGASALVITVLALCGVHMNWQIGALCAVPGWLMIRALTGLARYEREKMLKAHMERGAERTEREIEHREEEKLENQGEECRFCEDGKCTFGDGAEKCALQKNNEKQKPVKEKEHGVCMRCQYAGRPSYKSPCSECRDYNMFEERGERYDK